MTPHQRLRRTLDSVQEKLGRLKAREPRNARYVRDADERISAHAVVEGYTPHTLAEPSKMESIPRTPRASAEVINLTQLSDAASDGSVERRVDRRTSPAGRKRPRLDAMEDELIDAVVLKRFDKRSYFGQVIHYDKNT